MPKNAKSPKSFPRAGRKSGASVGVPVRGSARASVGTRKAALAKSPTAKEPPVTIDSGAPAVTASNVPAGLARIIRANASGRWMLPSLAAITPQYIEMVLRGALTGDHVRQWELFDLMLDTWPELAAVCQELTYAVSERMTAYEPWREEGDPPTQSALDRCALVSGALRRMRPDFAADENDLDGTIKDIVSGWFVGVTTLEIDWHVIKAGKFGTITAPRSTYWVHPNNFGWGNDGKLGLRVGPGLNILNQTTSPFLSSSAAGVVSFPDNKFLVGIHKAKSGTALGGALLRPLAWWWCAANFSSDWLLNLAQLFGIPFRWAEYDPNAPQATIDAICNMLQNMGSAGWAAFPTGTSLDMKDPGKSGDHSPQGDLLDRADRYARLLILGQTMSGGSGTTGKGGGQAFGTVESDIKKKRVDAASKYTANVITQQLIPAILRLNFGDDDECPSITLIEESEGDVDAAQRDQILSGMMPLSIPFLRKKYNQPEPEDGEGTTGPQINNPVPPLKLDAPGLANPQEPNISGKNMFPAKSSAPIIAGDHAGHNFHGNQHHHVIADEKWQGDPKGMHQRADAIMKGFSPVEHPQLGLVGFGRSGRRKTLSAARTPHEFQAAAVLPDLIRKGKVVSSATDRKNRSEIESIHKLQTGLTIGNTRYKSEITLRQIKGQSVPQRLHLHRLNPDDTHLAGKEDATGPYIAGPALQHDRGPGGSDTITRDHDDVKDRLEKLLQIQDDDDFQNQLHKLAQSL
jgi:phage gp29-like protein